MITISFCVKMSGEISYEEGKELWEKIQHGKEVNLMVFPNEAFAYGKTSVYVLLDILSHLSELGFPLQLNMK